MKTILFLAFLFLFSSCTHAQKKVVVLGSSTALGASATSFDSSWVGRLQAHFRKNTTDGDTTVQALGGYGYTSYHVMPTGYTASIANRPAVDPNNNITKALSLKPDILIVNLPSNDVANIGPSYVTPPYQPSETMNNLRALKQEAINAGVSFFITTPQPRNDINTEQRQWQRALVDSVNAVFGTSAINFWDDLVTNDGTFSLRDEVRNLPNADAAYHLNNTGHRLLFERVRTKNIFGLLTAITELPSSSYFDIKNISITPSGARITFKSDKRAPVTYFLLDITGKTLYSGKTMLSAPETSLLISLPAFPNGHYYLKAATQWGTKTKAFQKRNN